MTSIAYAAIDLLETQLNLHLNIDYVWVHRHS